MMSNSYEVFHGTEGKVRKIRFTLPPGFDDPHIATYAAGLLYLDGRKTDEDWCVIETSADGRVVWGDENDESFIHECYGWCDFFEEAE